jgi:glycosyltransferase involved in cell wall biosynthesis
VAIFLLAEWKSLDVILFHQMSAPWLLALRPLRRLEGGRRPLLMMDTRDLNPAGGGWRDKLRVSFYALAHWLANHWSDGQTAITERMADLVKIPPRLLFGTWPSGVIPERFAPAYLARCWPAPGEPIHLVYIGRLQGERNLMNLSVAVDRMNAQGTDFILSLVGDGPEQPALERFAHQAGERIRVLAPVPHEKVPELLAEAHVGVTSLPPVADQKYQASSPIKLFEYMAAGLPVLATRNACHVDVVGNGKYAFWAEDASVDGLCEALQAIWDAASSLQDRGQEALEAAQAWTWGESARQLKLALETGLARAG